MEVGTEAQDGVYEVDSVEMELQKEVRKGRVIWCKWGTKMGLVCAF